MTNDLKKQLEQQLAALIGLKLSALGYVAPTRRFHFGELRKVDELLEDPTHIHEIIFGRPHIVKMIAGQYTIHAAAWRLENDHEILTGSADSSLWKYKLPQPENWDYSKWGGLQDEFLRRLFAQDDDETRSYHNTTDQLVVQRVEATRYGDATLHLSGGYRLVLLPTSQFVEAWRLTNIQSDDLWIVGQSTNKPVFDPTTSADYVERGQIREFCDDDQGALDDYTEAIRLDPQNTEAYLKRGHIFDMEIVDTPRAIADFTEAIRLDPQNLEAYWQRGLIYYLDINDYDAAIADYTALIQLDPTGDWYDSRGMSYYAKGDDPAALADLNTQIQLEPSVDHYVHRSRIRAASGDSDGALADMDAAIALKPDSTFAYEWRGDLRDDLGDLDGAISDYTQALTLFPEHHSSLNGRAWALYQKGEYEAALKDANQAIEHQTADYYYHTRAMIYAALNQPARAIHDFIEMMDMNSKETDEIREAQAYIAKWVKAPDST